MISEVYMAQSLCNKEDCVAKLNYKLGWFYCQICLYSTLNFSGKILFGVPEDRECIHPQVCKNMYDCVCIFLLTNVVHVADLV